MATKNKKEQHPENKKLGKLYGIATATNLGAVGANLAIAKNQKQLTDDEIKDIIQERKNKFNIGNDIEYEMVGNMKAKSSSNFEHTPKIYTGNNEFILRHELGHTEDFYKKHNKRFNKVLKKGKTGEFKTYKSFIDLVSETNSLEAHAGKINDKKEALTSLLEKHKDNKLEADKIKRIISDLDKEKASIVNKIQENIKRQEVVRKATKTRYKDKLYRHMVTNVPRNIVLSSLRSQSVRDKIREVNDGKSIIIDKAINAMDKPLQGTISMGIINNMPSLVKENIASSKALKGLIESKGLKQGLKQGLPLYALQQGTYITEGIVSEAGKRMAINTIEDKIKKMKEESLEKKACYKEIIYQEAFNEMR